jgi:DNA-binding MarR family transcriptional regulator
LSTTLPAKRRSKTDKPYRLDDQVGFILRQVGQRHTTIFAAGIDAEITPTQWAALAKLFEVGSLSQNLLGRQTAMDAATIKGVVDRLTRRGLTETSQDREDGRRLLVTLTEAGAELVERIAPLATAITEETLQPLTQDERETLLGLLRRLR